ncbi:MAG TPA: TetR/AcrR family transcriptional regulator [Terriglobales bacterium]|nr:TetR/AcrR family transcriptional regulator [Terriglobales bacterium]
MSASTESRLGTRARPEESRAAILKAAFTEFAANGIAGARTDAIAKAAHVNKALLYYYFKDKDALYQAVLDHVFSGMREHVAPVFDSDRSPRQKVLDYVGAYFDYVAAHPQYPRVVQAEWMRLGSKGATHMQRIAKEYFAPIFQKLAQVMRAGVEAGEFRDVDPGQFVPSMVAIIVFYFSAVPVIRTLTQVDPLAPESVAKRRAFVLDFISAALFKRPVATGDRA